VKLEADRIAELAGRPVSALTRRDVALGLLSVGPDDALASLPVLRRRLLAAGNPLSAEYWASTERILGALHDGTARGGDVRAWLEATGTEPSSIIGLHVWDEPTERSRLQAEMHALLVRHLEEKLNAGAVDPDQLVTGDATARQAYITLQEQWMATPLPDGRVPMDALLDEQDAEFLAEWAAADSEALAALQEVLDEVGERPLPEDQLAAACGTARAAIAQDGLTGRLLTACGGAGERALPSSDVELWLILAAGVVSPAGEAARPAAAGPPEPAAAAPRWAESPTSAEPPSLADMRGAPADDRDDDGADEVSRVIGALCALEHVDWLAAVSALARGGPGTPASAATMARYVREYCETEPRTGPEAVLTGVPGVPEPPDALSEPGDLDGLGGVAGEDFDEEAVTELFIHVASLWEVLGASDAQQRLTPLGWWGLPEAMRKVWAPSS
jgi:hypothetical protein